MEKYLKENKWKKEFIILVGVIILMIYLLLTKRLKAGLDMPLFAIDLILPEKFLWLVIMAPPSPHVILLVA